MIEVGKGDPAFAYRDAFWSWVMLLADGDHQSALALLLPRVVFAC
jgi:hypothetical protein